MTDIRRAMAWLKDKGFVPSARKSDSSGSGDKVEHIGFDGLVAKLMAKGYSKESATKITGKVYWEQQGGGKKSDGANDNDGDELPDDIAAEFNSLVDELLKAGYGRETATEIAGKVLWGSKDDKGVKGVKDVTGGELKPEWPFAPSDTQPEKEHMTGCLRWAIEDQGMDHDKAISVCTGMWPKSGPWSVPSNPSW